MKLLTFFVALLLIQQNINASSLTISTFHFPPFSNCKTSPISGIEVELIRKAAARSSTPVTIICLPWKRLLYRMQKGTVDGAFPALYLDKREKFARYIDVPLHTLSVSIASRIDKKFTQINQLDGKIVGIQAGFFLSTELQQKIDAGQLTILETQGVLQNLKMLHRGRIDAYVDNHTVVDYFIKKLKMDKVINLSSTPANEGAPAFLMLSRQSEYALAQHAVLSQALKSLMAVHSNQTSPPEIDR